MAGIEKPKKEDLPGIENILNQWTEKEEVDKYLNRIANEINGQTEFNMQFWITKDDSGVLGIIGLSDLLPKVIPYTKTSKPAELKFYMLMARSKEGG